MACAARRPHSRAWAPKYSAACSIDVKLMEEVFWSWTLVAYTLTVMPLGTMKVLPFDKTKELAGKEVA